MMNDHLLEIFQSRLAHEAIEAIQVMSDVEMIVERHSPGDIVRRNDVLFIFPNPRVPLFKDKNKVEAIGIEQPIINGLPKGNVKFLHKNGILRGTTSRGYLRAIRKLFHRLRWSAFRCIGGDVRSNSSLLRQQSHGEGISNEAQHKSVAYIQEHETYKRQDDPTGIHLPRIMAIDGRTRKKFRDGWRGSRRQDSVRGSKSRR